MYGIENELTRPLAQVAQRGIPAVSSEAGRLERSQVRRWLLFVFVLYVAIHARFAIVN
jgi:hypothetical protein